MGDTMSGTPTSPSEVQPGFGFQPGQFIPNAPLIFPGENDLFMLLEITAEYAGYFGYYGEIVAFVAELIEFILELIDELVAVFSGKPRALDTLTVAHRLGTGQSPVAHLMSVQISRNLDQNNIVLSSSDPADQKILGHIRAQGEQMLVQQGVTAARAKQVIDEVWTQTIGKNQKLPAELDQPIPQGLLMVGTQQFQQDYINHYNARIRQGLDPLKAAQLATHWVLYNSKMGDLGKVEIRLKPLVILPGNPCLAGEHWDPIAMGCVPNEPSPTLPAPNNTPCPPFIQVPDCLGAPPGDDPDSDEVGDVAEVVGYWLGIIAIYAINMFQLMIGAPASSGNTDCCSQLILAIQSVATAIGSAPAPVVNVTADLQPVVDAIAQLTSTIAAFADVPGPLVNPKVTVPTVPALVPYTPQMFAQDLEAAKEQLLAEAQVNQ